MQNFKRQLVKRYIEKRPVSKRLHEEAQHVMPGGDTRSVLFFPPFPTFMECGKGCRLYDVDGNTYIDFLNNYTSLVLGHAHPQVVKAANLQSEKGTIYAAPAKSQIDLAREICARLPSAEKVRFCNSGSEATMVAIRLARFYSGKSKILKFEGGYHGSHDVVEISVKPSLDAVGPLKRPRCVPENRGIPEKVLQDCMIVPFNHRRVFTETLKAHHDTLAAVIVEPIMGSCGMIPASRNFLETVRADTRAYNIPLIFDEIISFRLSNGGAQELYDVLPDITTLGKLIGGGYPIGGIAGQEALMANFSPLSRPYLKHSGTFNGNGVSMAAGLQTLKALTPSEIDRINILGDQLRDRLLDIIHHAGIHAQVTGMGSLAQIHFTDQPVVSWRSAATVHTVLQEILHLLLLDHGIFTAPRGMLNLSTAMHKTEVAVFCDAFEECLREMKPFMPSS